MGAQGRRMQPPEDNTVAMATTDKYLFVVKGNTVYQFDVNTLQLKNKAALDPEKEKGKRWVKDAMMERMAIAKKRIQQLREEGKNEEADKLEAELKKAWERMKKMKEKPMGWGDDKGGDLPPKEVNKEGDVLF